MRYSKKWKNWRAILDPKTCKECREMHGTIYAITQEPNPKPPIHFNGRCQIVRLKTILAGHATKDNIKGIDWYLKYHGRIPDNYITKNKAIELGWIKEEGNLSVVAPGMRILGGIYHNRNGKLPSKEGRIWYEADINYEGGYRGDDRLLFSNDGLMFITTDHYETFIEVE